MNITIKQISSLEKVRSTDPLNHKETHHLIAMPGQRLSYQISMQSQERTVITASVASELAEYVKLYDVREACMDMPATSDVSGEDYITTAPGLMPDILVPLEESNYKFIPDGFTQIALLSLTM